MSRSAHRHGYGYGPMVLFTLWLVAGAAAGTIPGTRAGQGAGRDAPSPAQGPAGTTATTGTGVIAGTILSGDTGRVLRRVRVSLTNSETNANLGTVATDLQGRFSFTKLPVGSFTLKAAKTGYLDITYGQKTLGSGRPGTSIQLAEGQKVDTVSLKMPRGGVISGTVVDEAGDPAYGVPMRAMKYVMRNGVRELTAVATGATTDDRGQYRIPGLVPGEYIVCAAPRDEFVTAAALYESLQARLQDIRAAQAARGTVDPNMTNAVSMGPRPDDPKEAYVTLCFPGTTQMSAAATITAGIGEERAGHDLQLQLLPIAMISGTVTWSGGQLPIAGSSGGTTADAQVHLVDQAAPNNPSGPRVVHIKADGRFSFANVAPGQYTLAAHADVPAPQAAPGVAGQRPPAPGMTPLWASIDVNVAGQPIADLTLSMAHGMTVSGRVAVEGTPPVDISRLRLTAIPASPMYGEFSIPAATVDADGRFTIPGVVPGRYRIGSASGTPAGAVIKSSMFGGVDTLDFPIEVKADEHLTGGVLTAIPRFAEIAGQLQNTSSQPATGFTVIVFSAEPRYWTPASRRIQSARPATDGRFSLRNLPAGEYRLAAVTDVESGQWFDPAFLRELMGNAITVTLSEGERKDQALRVAR